MPWFASAGNRLAERDGRKQISATAATLRWWRGGAYCHVGLGVADRGDVDRLCTLAEQDGRRVFGPLDSGPPVGYWAYIVDPDGHNLEISHGQQVGFTVDHA